MKRTVFVLLFLASLGLLAQTNATTTDCNCCTEDHKAFDFWVGEWEVNNADGSAAGRTVITKEEAGCVLR